MGIKCILGTMTFGEQVFGEDAEEMIRYFLKNGYKELDTAYVYNNGECEKILGQALQRTDRTDYEISTKVNPRVTGRLDKEAVLLQMEESLGRLKIAQADILYLHFPDWNTPLESALEGCMQLYSEGKFRELGLSNFPAWMVAEVYYICEKHQWMFPKVYEGLYNPLSRFAEEELNDVLNRYGLRFNAYNPLAGGMLTDKYSGKDKALKAGRFINRPNYQDRYWKDAYFEAADDIKAVCKKYDINIVEAVYRWMIHHSMLSAERGDGIIVGASRISQLQQNVEALQKGNLPEDLLKVIDNAWEGCMAVAPAYFRFYGRN